MGDFSSAAIRRFLDQEMTRRRMAVLPAALLAASVPLAGIGVSQGALSQEGASDFLPMFRGGLARTGVMPGPGPDPGIEPETIWEFDAGSPIWSSVVVSDGSLFVGTAEGLMLSIDVKSGAERWRYATSDGITSTPVVIEGTVYFGSRNQGVYAIGAESGDFEWWFVSQDKVLSSPAVVEDLLYIGSDDGNLYALDRRSGIERWRYTSNGKVTSSPAVVDDVVYFGSHDGNLYALDAMLGVELWRFSDDSSVRSTPAVSDGVVFFGSHDGTVHALDSRQGTELWRFGTRGGVDSSPAVSDGIVICGSHDGNVYAVDAIFGTEIWRFAVDSRVNSSPTIVDGTVYVGSQDGRLHVIDMTSGALLWQFSTRDEIYASPAVANGCVYLGSHDQILYALGHFPPQLEPGGQARVIGSASLRGAPAPTGVVRAELNEGTIVTITGESEKTGKVIWWPVVVDDTAEQGWIDASYLEPYSDSQATDASLEVFELQAQDPFHWSVDDFSVVAGQMIRITNVGVMQHDFVVDELGIQLDLPSEVPVEVAIPDDAEFGSVYSFYCSVPGHREEGMEGTITIGMLGAMPESTPVREELVAVFNIVAVDLSFRPDHLEIPANQTVTISITNEGVLEHDFVVENLGVESGRIISGDSATVVITAGPGTYEFSCSIAGHAQAGMVGTLTVV